MRQVNRPASLRNLMHGVFVAVCLSSFAMAHETDQFSVPVGREFADLRYFLSEETYDYLFAAVNNLNKRIEASLRGGEPTESTARLQTAEAVAAAVYAEVPPVINHVETLDLRLGGPNSQRRFPGLVVVYHTPLWIYHHWALLLDPTKLPRLLRCGTVMANGTYFGTDKVVHFFHMGKIYFGVYQEALNKGASESEATQQAVALGIGGDPLSEESLLGSLSTGVFSNGDLAANFAGLKFFRNLTEPVALRGRTRLPMLVRDGEFWRLNEYVRRESDFLSAFISPHWNEVLNPSVFAFGMAPALREGIRTRCADVLYWYRDESGKPLSRESFLAVAGELTTFFGEDYGHKGDVETLLNVSTVCFPEPAANKGDRGSSSASDFKLASQRLEAGSSTAEAEGQSTGLDALGRDALWRASRAGRLQEVAALAADAGRINSADVDGETPLHAAARSGNVAVVESLLIHGARRDATSRYGLTPLHLAARSGHKQVVDTLVKQGADVNARDSFGCAPLHDAAGNGHDDVVAALIERGADMNARDNFGTTPLHRAARRGDAPIVRSLLDAGAILGRANAVGRSALDEALFSKERTTIELLKKHGNHATGR